MGGGPAKSMCRNREKQEEIEANGNAAQVVFMLLFASDGTRRD